MEFKALYHRVIKQYEQAVKNKGANQSLYDFDHS